jgi:hypothetical protein
MTQQRLDLLNISAIHQVSFQAFSGTPTVSGYFINASGSTTTFGFTLSTTASSITALYRTFTGNASNSVSGFVACVVKPTSSFILIDNGNSDGTTNSRADTVVIPTGSYRIGGLNTIAEDVFKYLEGIPTLTSPSFAWHQTQFRAYTGGTIYWTAYDKDGRYLNDTSSVFSANVGFSLETLASAYSLYNTTAYIEFYATQNLYAIRNATNYGVTLGSTPTSVSPRVYLANVMYTLGGIEG